MVLKRGQYEPYIVWRTARRNVKLNDTLSPASRRAVLTRKVISGIAIQLIDSSRDITLLLHVMYTAKEIAHTPMMRAKQCFLWDTTTRSGNYLVTPRLQEERRREVWYLIRHCGIQAQDMAEALDEL